MKFSILTLFPAMFQGPFSESIIARAVTDGVCELELIDIRDFTGDKHRQADDAPYGGGGGMVLKAGPVVEAIESVKREAPAARTIYLTPQGRRYDQQLALELSKLEHLILLCGHYEGIDERARELAVDREISIGDYVLTGGELPAMVLVDSIVRLLPGAVGNADSIANESFMSGRLDYPHYTRPPEFRGLAVPEVLLSGDHAKIAAWRAEQAEQRTRAVRPDLLED